MDPKACFDQIRAGVTEFERAASAGEPAWRLTDILDDIQQNVESLREWIAKSGFLA